MLAPFLGDGLALAAGGALYSWAQRVGDALPLVGGIEDWQLVFLVVGAVGIVPTLLLLLVVHREHARRRLDLAIAAQAVAELSATDPAPSSLMPAQH